MLHELSSSSEKQTMYLSPYLMILVSLSLLCPENLTFSLRTLFCFLLLFQCLSNTTPLTEYFVGTQAGYKPYKKHINRDNPLGMGGAIAEAYGALLDDIWSGKASCVAPRHFKVHKLCFAESDSTIASTS